MSSEHCFETARLYYNMKDYKKSFDISMQLLKEYAEKYKTTQDDRIFADNYKLGALAAKSLLFQLNSPNVESERNLFTNMVSFACQQAKTLDEIFWVENDVLTAFYSWEKQVQENWLETIIYKRDVDLFHEYIKIRMNASQMILCADAIIRNSPIISKHCSDNNLDLKVFLKEHSETLPTRMIDDETSYMNYEAAKRMHENIKNKLIEYSDVNIETAKTITSELTEEYVIAHVLATLNVNKENKDSYLKCLKLSAEIERDWFEATINANGSPLSIFRGNRQNQLNTSLKKTYEKICELEPDFEVPPLPSITYYDFQTSKSSGGGCYVATAVYGSYDCPEVWTLRRFRDNILAKNLLGRLFIVIYYAVSPTLVKWFGEADWFKNMWKPILDNKVKKLNLSGVENTPYNDRQW